MVSFDYSEVKHYKFYGFVKKFSALYSELFTSLNSKGLKMFRLLLTEDT